MRRIILVVILLPFLIQPANADGFSLSKSEIGKDSFLTPETRQLAYIGYKDGIEDLLISVSLKARYTGFVWLFPIPALPDGVEIDIVNTELPYFATYDTLKVAKRRADSIRISLAATPLVSFFVTNWGLTTIADYGREVIPHHYLNPYDSLGDGKDFAVHKSVTKFGVTTELVTGSSELLMNYFREKGYDIPEEATPIIDNYLDYDYSFVVAWGNPPDADSDTGGNDLVDANPAIKVVFPSEHIYYPLVPTSIYGAEVIPVELYINDWVVTLEDRDRTWFNERFEYYGPFEQKQYDVLPHRFKYLTENNRMTRIKFERPANLFLVDLRLKPANDKRLERAFTLFSYYRRIFWLSCFVIASITGIATGLIAFPWRKKPLDILLFWLFGLMVGLSIVAVIAASSYYCRVRKLSSKTCLIFTFLFFFMFIGLSELFSLFFLYI